MTSPEIALGERIRAWMMPLTNGSLHLAVKTNCPTQMPTDTALCSVARLTVEDWVHKGGNQLGETVVVHTAGKPMHGEAT